jgi:uncharacterized membrane protein
MEKEFVPYELAFRLKALGFDEPCLLHVNHYGEMKETRSSLWMLNGYLAECNDDEKITINYEFPNYPSNKEEYWQEINIPTFSQAFRWFREKYNLCSWVYQVEDNRYFFSQLKNGRYLVSKSSEYNTYEEAELACLEKLIEIIESKSE